MVRQFNSFLFVFALILATLLATSAVHAQGGGEGEEPGHEITEDEVNELSSQLYCPVCENVPLDVCPTEACARWRAQVRSLLEEGATDDEVITYFVDQFGQRVVGVPHDPGLAFLTWIVPISVSIIGVGLAVILVLRWRLNSHQITALPYDDKSPGSETGTEEDTYRVRLENELAQFDRGK